MSKPLFDKVTIVGVGLIGGSLGMAVKKRKLAKLVMGVVHRRQTIAQAAKIYRHMTLASCTRPQYLQALIRLHKCRLQQ